VQSDPLTEERIGVRIKTQGKKRKEGLVRDWRLESAVGGRGERAAEEHPFELERFFEFCEELNLKFDF
jgi:hypothetical protein